jgi:hypothetical protein
MKNLPVPGIEHVYSAGGKGAFKCPDFETAELLKNAIRIEAREIGIDIRFGMDADFSNAAKNTDDVYPFVPVELDGEPCNASGLYPLGSEKGDHPVIHKRLFVQGNKMFRWFENDLIKDVMLFPGSNAKLDFFHNVDANDETDSIGGKEGAAAIGNCNRWAVICMDGNDMGMQFRTKAGAHPSEDEMVRWIKTMSVALDRCSHEAVRSGIQEVIREWHDYEQNEHTPDHFVLPLRPIIVGGDDIVLLCHTAYARSFVKKAIRVFNETSKIEEKKNGKVLWPATNGELTVSAGILYCPVSLPLHTAITYAESLLASAKHRGREFKEDKKPSPASIDWEQITDSLVDTPASRRQRELYFYDDDIKETVELTQRPCTLGEFCAIEDLADKYKKKEIPPSVLHKILPALRAGYYERLAFAAEIKKHQKYLFEDLCEYPNLLKSNSRWKLDPVRKSRSTDVLDALILLEEESRWRKETI